MATVKEIGLTYGGTNIGKGLNYLFSYLDTALGKAGAPIYERPSFLASLIGATALPAIAIGLKVKSPWDKVMLAIGAFLSTNLWDTAKELVGGGAGARVGTRAIMVRAVSPPITSAPISVSSPSPAPAPAPAPAKVEAQAPYQLL